ncbi:hypothetical protein CFB40_23500 [Burkholderia sp. AU31652]|nr:hypothetical protein CFB40_23500 [Burkholderia sp. AU31652]OXJ10097.1 hypothetical protein CFB45_24315 [Burkholderia sp. HI2500]
MSNDATRLLVDQHVVAQLLVPDAVIAAVRVAFELHGQRAGRVFHPQRPSRHRLALAAIR